MSPTGTAPALENAVRTLAILGGPLGWLLLAASAALAVLCVTPAPVRWRRPALALVVALLAVGEALLLWFHWRLWVATSLLDRAAGGTGAGAAVPMWIESEKLYLWALIFGVMALAARRHREELAPVLGVFLALFTAGAVLVGRPFTEPLPQFVATVRAFAAAIAGGGFGDPATLARAQQTAQAYLGLKGYYSSPFMWVHPPLLFFCYGAFVVGFAAVVLMVTRRRGEFETTSYRWTRFGYLPLTLGMLLGFPWAITAWSGESWWWSGKVNISIMMWLLYTAYLHGRLYLRRQGMWRWVAVLAVLSFVALVLTYLTTYVIPGAHSIAG